MKDEDRLVGRPRHLRLLGTIPKEFLLERPMPNVPDAERTILGAIFLDNTLFLQAHEEGLTPEYFYVLTHRYVYDAMMLLFEKGSEVDPVLVTEELRRTDSLGMAGGMTQIMNLMHGIPHFVNIQRYVKLVKNKFFRRTLIQLCELISSRALDEPDLDEQELFSQAEEGILQVTNAVLRENIHHRGRDPVVTERELVELRDHIIKTSEGHFEALPTGIGPLDDKLEGGGLNKQGLYLIAASPKAGKTSLVLGIANRIGKQFSKNGQQKSVVIFSLEMRRRAIQMRLFASSEGIPYDTLVRPGKLKGEEREKVLAKLAEFAKRPIHISDAVFTIPELKRACERAVYGKLQAGLIIVDYLQLLSLASNKSADPNALTGEVTIVSRELKHLAQELDVPLMGISSLNRLGELRQSGSIDYDVECLIRLENPSFSPKMTLEQRAFLDEQPVWDINARIVYQRNGPTGDIPLKFVRRNMEFLTVYEYERITQQQSGSSGKTLNDLWNTTTGSDDDPESTLGETYEF